MSISSTFAVLLISIPWCWRVASPSFLEVSWLVGVPFAFDWVVLLLCFVLCLSLSWCNGLDSVHGRCQLAVGCSYEVEINLFLGQFHLYLLHQDKPLHFLTWFGLLQILHWYLTVSALEVYWCMFSGKRLSASLSWWFLPSLQCISKLKSASLFTQRWPVVLSLLMTGTYARGLLSV